MKIGDVCRTFSLLDDWRDRYAYIIELGSSIPPFPESLKVPENRVSGCVSQVWVVSSLESGRLVLKGDSNSRLVKGLMAIVFIFCAEKSVEEVAIGKGLDKVLCELGLMRGLTPQRSDGLRSLVARVKLMAQSALKSTECPIP